MKKRMKELLFGLGLFVSLTCIGSVGVYADTLTMTIERSTLGGGMIVEPEVVEFTPGENYAQVLTRVLDQKGLAYSNTGSVPSGFYLQGIRGVGVTDPSVPSCVQDILQDYGWTQLQPNTTGDLYEKYYTEGSGWMYYINNQYVMGMSEVRPQQGDAARFMYTLAYGADLTGYRTNPITNQPEKNFYTTADKSDLVRKMGEVNQDRARWESNSNCQAAYENAVWVMENILASDYSVRGAIDAIEQAWASLDATPTDAPQPTSPAGPTDPTDPAGSPTPAPTTPPAETVTPTPDHTVSPIPTPPVRPTGTATPTPSPTETPTTPTPSPKPDVPDQTAGKTSIRNVTSTAYNKLRITWDRAEGATGYVVYRSDSSQGRYKEIGGTSGADILSYVDSSVTTGKIYYYKVCAIGEGLRQGSLSAAKQGRTLPNTPSVTVSSGKGKAVIKWKKTNGAAGYNIYRATSKNGKYQKIKTVAKKSAGSYTDKKVKAKKTYYYKVRAYCNVSGKKIEGNASAARQAKIKVKKIEK